MGKMGRIREFLAGKPAIGSRNITTTIGVQMYNDAKAVGIKFNYALMKGVKLLLEQGELGITGDKTAQNQELLRRIEQLSVRLQTAIEENYRLKRRGFAGKKAKIAAKRGKK